MKRMSTKTHGFVDYMTSTLMGTLPNAMGWSSGARWILGTAAGMATIYSMLTRYELGVVKVLPMRAHLAMDAISGASLVAAAAMCDDLEDEERMAIAGFGAFEILASLSTQTQSSLEVSREQGWERHATTESQRTGYGPAFKRPPAQGSSQGARMTGAHSA